MEEHVSPLTQWFNHIFAPIALSLLHALHIQPKDYDAPIPEYVVMAIVVLILCTILALILRARLSRRAPRCVPADRGTPPHQSAGFSASRIFWKKTWATAAKNISRSPVDLPSSFLLANLLSVFPAFSAPTAFVYVPLACASLTFIVFQLAGRKASRRRPLSC